MTTLLKDINMLHTQKHESSYKKNKNKIRLEQGLAVKVTHWRYYSLG